MWSISQPRSTKYLISILVCGIGIGISMGERSLDATIDIECQVGVVYVIIGL
jgi:hypothetical protein